VAITVNDLDESLKFYQDFFNFTVVKEFESLSFPGAKAIFIELHGVALELWKFKDMKRNSDDLADIKIKGIRHIAFEVDNIDKTVSELREKGLTISEPKLGASEHRFCFTKDPNGIALELYEK